MFKLRNTLCTVYDILLDEIILFYFNYMWAIVKTSVYFEKPKKAIFPYSPLSHIGKI